MTSFPYEFRVYLGRISQFSHRDRVSYAVWVGLMASLSVVTASFLGFGRMHSVRYPFEAWLVPIGASIFTSAIGVDTIGHLTIYKEVLKKAERLVHQITIFAGITACLLLSAAYEAPSHFTIPGAVFTLLSFLYSLIDEVFHWKRYESKNADRVEMWSHVFILIGHGTMMWGWWAWCRMGYPGVSQTVALLRAG